MGTYEYGKAWDFARMVEPGSIVYDIGAHAGYYSLIAAARGATVVAVEPNPTNLMWLRDHVMLNRLENSFTIEARAVSGSSGSLSFAAEGTYMGRLITGGELEVQCITLDELAAKHGHPQLIKMDIEGAEADVLDASSRVFESRPTIWLATHGEYIRSRCMQRLDALGYRVRALPDPRELLAAHPQMGQTK